MNCKIIQISFPKTIEMTEGIQKIVYDLAQAICINESPTGKEMYISSTGTHPKMENGKVVGFHHDFYHVGCKMK